MILLMDEHGPKLEEIVTKKAILKKLAADSTAAKSAGLDCLFGKTAYALFRKCTIAPNSPKTKKINERVDEVMDRFCDVVRLGVLGVLPNVLKHSSVTAICKKKRVEGDVYRFITVESIFVRHACCFANTHLLVPVIRKGNPFRHGNVEPGGADLSVLMARHWTMRKGLVLIQLDLEKAFANVRRGRVLKVVKRRAPAALPLVVSLLTDNDVYGVSGDGIVTRLTRGVLMGNAVSASLLALMWDAFIEDPDVAMPKEMLELLQLYADDVASGLQPDRDILERVVRWLHRMADPGNVAWIRYGFRFKIAKTVVAFESSLLTQGAAEMIHDVFVNGLLQLNVDQLIDLNVGVISQLGAPIGDDEAVALFTRVENEIWLGFVRHWMRIANGAYPFFRIFAKSVLPKLTYRFRLTETRQIEDELVYLDNQLSILLEEKLGIWTSWSSLRTPGEVGASDQRVAMMDVYLAVSDGGMGFPKFAAGDALCMSIGAACDAVVRLSLVENNLFSNPQIMDLCVDGEKSVFEDSLQGMVDQHIVDIKSSDSPGELMQTRFQKQLKEALSEARAKAKKAFIEGLDSDAERETLLAWSSLLSNEAIVKLFKWVSIRNPLAACGAQFPTGDTQDVFRNFLRLRQRRLDPPARDANPTATALQLSCPLSEEKFNALFSGQAVIHLNKANKVHKNREVLVGGVGFDHMFSCPLIAPSFAHARHDAIVRVFKREMESTADAATEVVEERVLAYYYPGVVVGGVEMPSQVPAGKRKSRMRAREEKQESRKRMDIVLQRDVARSLDLLDVTVVSHSVLNFAGDGIADDAHVVKSGIPAGNVASKRHHGLKDGFAAAVAMAESAKKSKYTLALEALQGKGYDAKLYTMAFSQYGLMSEMALQRLVEFQKKNHKAKASWPLLVQRECAGICWKFAAMILGRWQAGVSHRFMVPRDDDGDELD